MGGKKRTPPRAAHATGPAPAPGRGGPPWILIGGLAAVIAVVAVGMLSRTAGDAPPDGADHADHAADAAEPPDRPAPPPRTEPPTPIPPVDAAMPPLPLAPNLIPRDPDVIRAAYTFAAQHPEVLEYVPCFCGCETRGHRRNADCFVESRHADGSVREWDTHGMACIVCVDVARTAMQLHASGGRVTDIRAAVESQYGAYERQTPTPLPPEPTPAN